MSRLPSFIGVAALGVLVIALLLLVPFHQDAQQGVRPKADGALAVIGVGVNVLVREGLGHGDR